MSPVCLPRLAWPRLSQWHAWRCRSPHLLALTALMGLLAAGLVACSGTGPTVTLSGPPKVVVRSSDPMTAAPRGETFAIAKCLAGEQMVGGGYLLTPGAFPIAPYFSYPATPSIWSADVHNPTDAPMTVTAYATCLESATDVGMVIVKGDAKTIFGGAAGESLALCPSGALVTGGGYALSGGEMTLYIDGSGPGDGEWVVDAHATTPAATFQAYALCATQHLSAPAPHAHIELDLKLPNDIGAVVATCPDATWLLTGGGFAKLTGENLIVGSSRPVLTTTLGSTALAAAAWEVGGRNSSAAGAPPERVFDYAICAQVIAALHPATATPTPTPSPTATPPPTATAAPAAAKISVTPSTADAFCLNGQYPPITVKNSGGGTLSWSAQASDQAVTVNPNQGSLAAGASKSLTISGSHPAPPGSTLSINFTSNGGNATVTFTCKQ
jgi:hypothetical protein